MRPLLDLLAQDRFLRRMVAIGLKVGATLVVLFSLAVFFHAGRVLFDLPPNGILGGVLFEALFVLAVYAAVHVLVLRARQIEALPAGDYPALRMAPFLVRALAEAYAAFVSLVAVGGGIFVWFTNLSLEKVLYPPARSLFVSARSDPTFLGGIEFMLIGMLSGYVVLLIAYVIAEALRLMTRSVPAAEDMRPAEERFRSRFG